MLTIMRLRFLYLLLFVVIAVSTLVLFSTIVFAQTETATLSGVVTDPQGAVVPGVEVVATRIETGTTLTNQTNGTGIYFFTGLMPGHYHLVVRKQGFKEIAIKEIELHVQDKLERNFSLDIGSLSETITVEGGAPLLNTESASVSTVVDRNFAENMPMNGRSFQTLMMLTPGVVLTPTSADNLGQFSVNGQRSDSNYFTVDGVSANVGIAAGQGLQQSAGGSLPAFSALGGTNSLVSVDAMQEFRLQTSSFAPEFGRTPGGQISIATRSGTNQFHGTLFDYFRNDALDANDWFSNHNGLARPKERQNDFGGVLGGPIIRDRMFFFFSYEGLRLSQPLSKETVVPDSNTRQQAPAAVQTYLNAFPVANGPNFGGGLAQFNASYSNPATLDAYSIRTDYVINSKLSLFGRYNYSPSEVTQRNSTDLSTLGMTTFTTHTLTTGIIASLSNEISNELRANYSNIQDGLSSRLDNFGGAAPPPDSALFPTGISSGNGNFAFTILGAGSLLAGKSAANEQRQINVVDNLSATVGAHQLKFGVDYRWISPISGLPSYAQSIFFLGISSSGNPAPGYVLSGSPLVAAVSALQSTTLLSKNLSLYGQDTWKIGRRLTLTYGLRWEINPPLKGKNAASELYTVEGLDNPATMTLAPHGTPLYATTYGNVAPRLGAAYQLRQRPGRETVLRGGIGIFYDLGSGALGELTYDFPFTANNIMFYQRLPLTPQQAVPPAITPSLPTKSPLDVAVPNLKLPRTYQWNVAAEQSLGPTQTISVTYVGAAGRNLLRPYTLSTPNANFGSDVIVTTNTASSSYQALQLKFQRRASRGLVVITSYTFSHSIDNASSDSSNYSTAPVIGNPSIDRGNSAFDVRHTVTGALTYDVPFPFVAKGVHEILSNWSLDCFLTARSALPVDLIATTLYGSSGVSFNQRPNVVPGVPFYLLGPQYPGGKAFNPAAFSVPPSAQQQGSLGRNVLRGFGAWQDDLTIRRQFHLTEKIGLQFRAEFFNLFNHPNFGSPTNGLGSPLFGLSAGTLASSLGSGGANGGFSPLYQIGGPRSIQLALKLTF